MGKLADYGNIHASEEVKKIDEVEGQHLTINSFSEAEGDYGDYAFIFAETDKGEEVAIMTGARLILEALRDVQAKNEFPVEATFRRRGRAWIAE